MSKAVHRPTYAESLLSELDDIDAAYAGILRDSGIENVDPNRPGSVQILNATRWGWSASDDALEAARMALLQLLRRWAPRFRLLFPHPTPTVSERLDSGIELLERWLVRPWDKQIPPTIAQAEQEVRAMVESLRGLINLLPADDYARRLVVDTNALIDNPDITAYRSVLGDRYVVHVLPVVLGEIDDLKRGGRNPDVRAGAQRAERRLKGVRNNGDVHEGVRVAGGVVAKFEHVEPRSTDLPDWLDLSVPDDRLVASTLLLQSEHPRSALYVATSDINLQTKLTAVGLPYIEPPSA